MNELLTGIIDLHTHTFFSDGELSPGELVRRAEYAGYAAIAITDHVDASNLDHVVSSIVRFCETTQPYVNIVILPGVELTHVPPAQIKSLADDARAKGAKLVVLHGETICEPVAAGTNKAGIEAGIDILAHPGLITEEEAVLAAERGVYLEISGRRSHGLSNGRVLQLARKYNARCVLDTDAHLPGDLFTPAWREKVGLGSGMTSEELAAAHTNMEAIVRKCLGKVKNC